MSATQQTELSRVVIPPIEILSLVPVVRCADLVRRDPTLTIEQTREAHAIVKREWSSQLSERYRAKAAEISGIPEHQLQFDAREKEVRYRIDGKTPMIDLPRLRTVGAASDQFDQRSCIALCIDDFSSKVWTRVGPPTGTPGVSMDEIGKRTDIYRRHANTFGNWFGEVFRSMTQVSFEKNEVVGSGNLEVTTVGLLVEREPDDDYFEDWLLNKDRPNLANADLRKILAAAGRVKFDLRDLDRKEPDSYWIAIPNTVELQDGELTARQFLYLVRPTGNDWHVVGIGFDDSGRGELTSDVGLKIARFIANRI